MIKIFVISLPHSATSYLYKVLKEKYNLKGLFEPFNHEVLHDLYHFKTHAHYIIGLVPHDYFSIPKELFDKMYKNSFWMVEWENEERPKKPFLGEHFWEIIDDINNLNEEFVVKDVHAWVYFEKLYKKLKDTEFYIPLPTFERILRSALKFLKIKPNPKNLAQYGIFYRYFHDFEYPKEANEEAVKMLSLIHI